MVLLSDILVDVAKEAWTQPYLKVEKISERLNWVQILQNPILYLWESKFENERLRLWLHKLSWKIVNIQYSCPYFPCEFVILVLMDKSRTINFDPFKYFLSRPLTLSLYFKRTKDFYFLEKKFPHLKWFYFTVRTTTIHI